MATHNRAGEITLKHLSEKMYELNLITYTDVSPGVSADRQELEISWGDGTFSVVQRSNGYGNQGEYLQNNTKKNIYTAIHTYPAEGNFVISMEDPNRNEGVINIPGSVNISFYLETKIDVGMEANNSVSFLSAPILNAAVGKPFSHNLTAFDPDGDLLSYQFVACKGEGGQDISGYSLPEGMTISLEGQINWIPGQLGYFNIAVVIGEWRNGVCLGYVLRDFQITVDAGQDFDSDFDSITGIALDIDGNYALNLMPGDTLAFTVDYHSQNNNNVSIASITEADYLNIETLINYYNHKRIDCSWILQPSEERCSPYIFTFRGTQGIYSEDLSVIVYAGDTSLCNYPSNIDTFINNPKVSLQTELVKIGPIPAINFELNIFIKPGTSLDNLNFKLFDIFGKEALSEAVAGHSFKIKPEKKLSGIYVYKLEGGNKETLQTGKIVFIEN